MNNDFDNDSDSDDDYDDEEYEELYFDPDEVSNTRFNIVLCELYCKLHGTGVDNKMYYYHLNISSFKKFDINKTNNLCNSYNTYYFNLINNPPEYNVITEAPPFSPIRNFDTIVSKKNYITPQIAENITLDSGHCICIIKTIWLKLIQRTWKKIYALRNDIIRRRCTVNSLKTREITGYWPENCRVYPQLHGMMSYLL